jgi:hypothetical protein
MPLTLTDWLAYGLPFVGLFLSVGVPLWRVAVRLHEVAHALRENQAPGRRLARVDCTDGP